MNEQNFCTQRKPDIDYPCAWEYKVIGKDEEKLKAALLSACLPAVPSITLSNISSKGTYFSFNASLVVKDEEMRLQIFYRLQNSPDVKIVI
ncbi:MAG: DUF493 domain-containing protein [Desulfofustis sp.]|jgi:putative lipoic acid-binding regulatory protein|nr:DUF493 domain-containing protein [Desulfofustis sp.]